MATGLSCQRLPLGAGGAPVVGSATGHVVAGGPWAGRRLGDGGQRPPMATVLLARHGETAWNRERRLQGWAPVGLSPRGRDQARALGAALADRYVVDAVESSDLRRARETADLVAAAVDAPVRDEPGWRERDFGVLQGVTYEAFDAEHGRYSLARAGEAAVDRRPEGGESLADLRERVLDAWRRLLDDLGDDETRLVVTHGGPLYLVCGHLADRDVVEAVLDHRQANCALNEVRVEDGEIALVRENDREVLAERPDE